MTFCSLFLATRHTRWGGRTGELFAKETCGFVNGPIQVGGLKLVPTKAELRVLVIDHVERPSEN
jgi:hypothetical protein